MGAAGLYRLQHTRVKRGLECDWPAAFERRDRNEASLVEAPSCLPAREKFDFASGLPYDLTVPRGTAMKCTNCGEPYADDRSQCAECRQELLDASGKTVVDDGGRSDGGTLRKWLKTPAAPASES